MGGERCDFSDYVQKVLGEYGPQDIDLQESAANFRGAYAYLELGWARVFKLQTNMGWLTKRRANAARRDEHFVLTLLQKGAFSITQRGQTAHCSPNNISFLSDSAVLESMYQGEVEVLAIRFPSRLVRAYFPAADRICGRAVETESGCAAAVTDLMLRIWREHQSADKLCIEALLNCIMRLLEGAFMPDGAPAVESGHDHHLRRVRQLVDREFTDPKLSARSIAKSLGLSEGYLHAAVRGSGSTVGEMIFEKRLEACQRQLVDPALRQRTVTEIAFGSGFSSLPHFSRRFKERYGCSPLEYRRQMLTFNALAEHGYQASMMAHA